MLANDSLYHDQTIFDQFVGWSRQCCAQALPEDRDRRWGSLFLGFSLLLSGIATYFLISTLFADSASSAGAHLISALLMVFAIRFFLSNGEQMLTPARINTPPTLAPTSQSPTRTPAVADKTTHAKLFFRTLRKAGINVKIARAIFTGGIKCAEDLDGKTDAELLAIRGVGPATVRKLRASVHLISSSSSISR